MSLDRRAILRGLGAAGAAGRARAPGHARPAAGTAGLPSTSLAPGLPAGSRPGPEGAPDA